MVCGIGSSSKECCPFYLDNRKQKPQIFLICLYTSFNVIPIIRAVYVICENTLEKYTYILKSKLTVLHRRKDVQKEYVNIISCFDLDDKWHVGD